MTDLSDGRRFWLGGKLGWSWSDGTPWDYQNWFPGQPSGDGRCLENFASINQLNNQSTWNDRGCTNIDDGHGDLGYVCKKFNRGETFWSIELIIELIEESDLES